MKTIPMFLVSLTLSLGSVFGWVAAEAMDEYAVADIPPLLTEDADAVVRLEEVVFEAESRKKATETVRRVVSIFNSTGRKFGVQVVYYDKFRKVKDFEGLIRDASGQVIRRLKEDEIQDVPAISGFSLYEDNRAKIAELYHSEYPYTVEFAYQIEHDGLMNWRTWYPQSDEIAVEKASFEVRAPNNLDVRYKTRGMDLKPETETKRGRKIYRWQVDLAPIPQREPYSPSWRERMPSVMVASQDFEIDGFAGNMATWRDFGRFYYELNQNRDVLPENAKQEVERLLLGITDPVGKARKIYDYLQSTTRYVSIQLGIGGWQSFDASYVFERKYGDCKALTNYMYAMLKHAGIEAFPALVLAGAGQADLVTDFPCNQFNHVILCVPQSPDTLWLECTSQTAPFGHLGTFTEDRMVLVVSDKGGRLVRTPKSRADDNRQIRRAYVVLDENGKATVVAKTEYTGNQQDRVRRTLARSSDRDRKKWLRNSLDLPSFTIREVDFSEVESKELSVTIPVELTVSKYASRSNARLFFKPNVLERWSRVPPAVEKRTQPVHLAYPYTDIDTVSYTLPLGFSVEAAPDSVEIERTFGTYKSHVREDSGMLTYVRELELRENKLPAQSYAEYREFIQEIVKADNAQVVLVKKP